MKRTTPDTTGLRSAPDASASWPFGSGCTIAVLNVHRPEFCKTLFGTRTTGRPPLLYSTSTDPLLPTANCVQVKTLKQCTISYSDQLDDDREFDVLGGGRVTWPRCVHRDTQVLRLRSRTSVNITQNPYNGKNKYRRTDVGHDGDGLTLLNGHTDIRGREHLGAGRQEIGRRVD